MTEIGLSCEAMVWSESCNQSVVEMKTLDIWFLDDRMFLKNCLKF